MKPKTIVEYTFRLREPEFKIPVAKGEGESDGELDEKALNHAAKMMKTYRFDAGDFEIVGADEYQEHDRED